MNPFTFYVIQFAHTDIGYTHPQEQIMRMYLEHYDRVLELCRESADAPEASRFKWVCETAWQVRHYLEHRPERVDEFLSYVRRGQIEVTANYLHFTDLIDADALRKSFEWVVNFSCHHDVPLKCAVHSDVNGWPWALADILADLGVPYFLSHTHIDSGTDPLGARGSVNYHWLVGDQSVFRPGTPFRIPQAFWWQGPESGRVLHWLGDHYNLGNVLGLSSFKHFAADKTRNFTETDRLSVDDLLERAGRELPLYLERLRAGGYPRDIGLISTGGFFVDNAPPDTRWCDVVARWNANCDIIKLRTATLSEWFEALTAKGDDVPTHHVAWPDHWAHGLGSVTKQIAQARRTVRRRPRAATVVRTSGSAVAAEHLETSLEAERFALEHTFGAWSTAARPGAPGNDFQTAIKDVFFHRAELYLDEAVGAALRALIPAGAAEARLFAPPVQETCTLHFDAGDLDLADGGELIQEDGRVTAYQREHDILPHYVAAVQARPLSGLRLKRAAPKTSEGERAADGMLENRSWRLTVDPVTGGLTSLYAREAGREWVAQGAAPAFGGLIHEQVVHPLGRERIGTMGRLLADDVLRDEVRARFERSSPIFERNPFTVQGGVQRLDGPVFAAVTVDLTSSSAGAARAAWRLYHDLPLAELVLDWEKRWSDLPEAAYVTFPFAVRDGALELETSGGFFRPGDHGAGGQLPGTCSSYYTVQRAAKLTAGDASLLWLPLDAPLVMTNEMDYARWQTQPYTWNGFLASMPVNHYWHTNFPTSQRGSLRLRYRFFNPHGLPLEAACMAALPLEALGWR